MARRLFWLAFLGSAAVLAALPEFFGEQAEPMAMPRPQRLAALPEAAAPVSAAVAPAVAEVLVPAADLFAVQSWYVAPPPPTAMASAPPPPPPKPTAPPLPFKFIGKLDDRQHLQVFLLRGEQVLVVREGDLIDKTYKVQRIDAERMTLVYLPLDVAQSLDVGSAL
ncbi:secretion system X translation initiation factor [Metapseudomonas lalkuanensis]|uniref:Secretion system X translation initiation factor n=1 Tax=Metapseudomonas lalkuanensis TaxID=2604832 RepID=A0A5J6QUN5_9GAMM|nr:secretion system X translation initiation factor [Pseudomonas lalkuanensis]QEY65031.1 secretion system X translation initiation factor [Pseudomonas lalkuanensis]UCO97548.1 secretion system X translation initiation factor [Pseudomonas lalkuanensis]